MNRIARTCALFCFGRKQPAGLRNVQARVHVAELRTHLDFGVSSRASQLRTSWKEIVVRKALPVQRCTCFVTYLLPHLHAYNHTRNRTITYKTPSLILQMRDSEKKKKQDSGQSAETHSAASITRPAAGSLSSSASTTATTAAATTGVVSDAALANRGSLVDPAARPAISSAPNPFRSRAMRLLRETVENVDTAFELEKVAYEVFGCSIRSTFGSSPEWLSTSGYALRTN
jgi:hypothetical protein